MKLFYSELKKLKGKYTNFNDYEQQASNLALKLHVPLQNYEKYYYD